jgi:hypothetical protein
VGPVRLNLGCGNTRLDGFIGLDLHPCAGADVVGSLLSLPLVDGCAEEVLLDNVIEHVLDIPALLAEVRRVCKPGARVKIVTPHFTSLASWRDPTHLHHLSFFSMEHFAKPAARHYVGGGFAIRRKELRFGRGPLGLLGRLFFRLSPLTWEKQLCFVFRARTLTFELEVQK